MCQIDIKQCQISSMILGPSGPQQLHMCAFVGHRLSAAFRLPQKPISKFPTAKLLSGKDMLVTGQDTMSPTLPDIREQVAVSSAAQFDLLFVTDSIDKPKVPGTSRCPPDPKSPTSRSICLVLGNRKGPFCIVLGTPCGISITPLCPPRRRV
jgi:hypothetical protein